MRQGQETAFPSTIAIDGVAGSGKSTIGAALAAELGYSFIDTGKLYRVIADEVLLAGVDATDEQAVLDLARTLHFDVESLPESGQQVVTVRGKALAARNLDTPEINQTVPIVAAYPQVRDIVRHVQQEIARKGQAVIAGRDIGTVVLPNADLKIFMEVSLEERVARRYATVKDTLEITPEEIRADLLRRDALDSNRSESPMRVPEDAIVVRTDGLKPSETVQLLRGLCAKAQPRCRGR